MYLQFGSLYRLTTKWSLSNDAESVVKRMVQLVVGTKRNITMDNWFTSLPVVKSLLSEKQLTVVGTLRKNKTCIL